MDKFNITVLSDESYPSMKFKNVSEIERGDSLEQHDSIMVIKNNDDKTLQTIYLSDLAKYFSDVNVENQWYLPTISDGQLKFVWSENTANAPSPIIIDISSLIPLASDTTDGRMSSLDKVTLDNVAQKISSATLLEYSANININKGQFVIYNGKLYKALTTITAANNKSWNANNFKLLIG